MNDEMLKQVIDALLKMTDLLYQENFEYGYKILHIILPNLEKVIFQIQNRDEQEELLKYLNEALIAMEEEDNILFGDIMKYEVVERLQNYVK